MSCYVNIDDELSGHTAARNASLSSSLLLISSSAALSSFKKRKLPTMDGGSLFGDRDESEGLVVCCYGWMSTDAYVANKVAFILSTFVCQEVTIFNSPVRSLRHTIDGVSYPSSPEDSSCSPPSPLDFNKTVEEEAQAFSALLDRCTFYSATFKTAVLCRHGRRIVLCISSSCGCERSGGLG